MQKRLEEAKKAQEGLIQNGKEQEREEKRREEAEKKKEEADRLRLEGRERLAAAKSALEQLKLRLPGRTEEEAKREAIRLSEEKRRLEERLARAEEQKNALLHQEKAREGTLAAARENGARLEKALEAASLAWKNSLQEQAFRTRKPFRRPVPAPRKWKNGRAQGQLMSRSCCEAGNGPLSWRSSWRDSRGPGRKSFGRWMPKERPAERQEKNWKKSADSLRPYGAETGRLLTA